jgi:genome maintenance exonuclease 1
VGLYRGNPAIVDFKQSLKPKKHEWIQDYFHQLAAYALAHDVVHGTTITHGYVLIALQTGGTQEFSTTGAEFERYKTAWLERVDRFLSQASAGLPPASQPPQ